MKDQKYFVLILNRFSKKWEVRECPNEMKAIIKFERCCEFPQLSWEMVYLAVKVNGEKKLLKRLKLYGNK